MHLLEIGPFMDIQTKVLRVVFRSMSKACVRFFLTLVVARALVSWDALPHKDVSKNVSARISVWSSDLEGGSTRPQSRRAPPSLLTFFAPVDVVNFLRFAKVASEATLFQCRNVRSHL